MENRETGQVTIFKWPSGMKNEQAFMKMYLNYLDSVISRVYIQPHGKVERRSVPLRIKPPTSRDDSVPTDKMWTCTCVFGSVCHSGIKFMNAM